MTVQELYDMTRKAGHDPHKVELFLAEGIPSEDATVEGDGIAEVAFEKHPEERRTWRAAYLVTEGSIHL